jgi:hypothetical protein
VSPPAAGDPRDRLPATTNSKIFGLAPPVEKPNLNTFARHGRLAAPGGSEKTRGNNTAVSANFPGERPSTLPLVWMATP